MAKVGAAIIGTGSYLPEKVLSNFDFEKFLDTSDEWITTRTGIRERRIAADDQTTTDLAYQRRQGEVVIPGSGPYNQ